jgi:hypothetical protein
MENWYFVLMLALLITPLFAWGFSALPQERWQILCAIPVRKFEDGKWQGLNLTYYGLFVATSLSAAVALVMVLIGAAGIDFGIFAAIVAILVAICLMAAKVIVLWVEKKRYGFSVGAASFVGIIFGPWLVYWIEKVSLSFSRPFASMAVIAAAAIGYALGEGLGRLACISFGCCYGKPMHKMPRLVQRYFGWVAFRFSGSTKKIAYAHQWEERKIFAIQAVTAVFYTGSALVGTWLYLEHYFAGAFFLCLTTTQGWRFCSEFFRSDFRGHRKITIYQIMSLLTIPYAALILWRFPSPQDPPVLKAGLNLLWNPAAILFLQILWLVVFLTTGRSRVTGSALSFHVHQDRI